MTGTAIVMNTEHQTPENRGRMAHALHLAAELHRAGRPLKLLFTGKGVEWLPQLLNPNRDQEHPFVQNYGHLFDEVREHVEACNFCCIRFDQLEAVAAGDIPIRGEGRDHVELSPYVLEGWNVITF